MLRSIDLAQATVNQRMFRIIRNLIKKMVNTMWYNLLTF